MVQHYEKSFSMSGNTDDFGTLRIFDFTVSSIILPTVIELDVTADFNNTSDNTEIATLKSPTIHGWSGSRSAPAMGTEPENGDVVFKSTVRHNTNGAGNAPDQISANTTASRRINYHSKFKDQGNFGQNYLNPSMTYGIKISPDESYSGPAMVSNQSISVDVKIIGRKMT